MYERRIEYKDLSFIENPLANKNNTNKERTSHSFGFIHNIPEEGQYTVFIRILHILNLIFQLFLNSASTKINIFYIEELNNIDASEKESVEKRKSKFKFYTLKYQVGFLHFAVFQIVTNTNI